MKPEPPGSIRSPGVIEYTPKRAQDSLGRPVYNGLITNYLEMGPRDPLKTIQSGPKNLENHSNLGSWVEWNRNFKKKFIK